MSIFEGIWVPMVTPFRDGRLDLDAAQRLAVHLADQGVDGLIVCGTTGEAATLDEAERDALLAAVIAAVGARCPVVMGLAGDDTRAVARDAARFERPGLAGYLVSAPYYVRPSQEGVRRHFEEVARACTLPIVLYNIPYRTGVNIELSTVQALSANPRFVAIKESGNGNMAQLADLIAHTPLKVLNGEDAYIFLCGCLGGHGAIAAAAHIRPDLYVRMHRQLRRGELEPARRIANLLQPLIRLLFSEPNPGPVKAALAWQGMIAEELRLPMTAVTPDCRARLHALLPTLMQAAAG